MFNQEQRMMLKMASISYHDKTKDLSVDNPKLNEVIMKLKQESPHLFITKAEKHTRKFWNEPTQLHRMDYHSFVVPKLRFANGG